MNPDSGLTKLRCASCGAALELSRDADNVTCAYCGSQQIVLHRQGQISLKLICESAARMSESAARMHYGVDRTAAELAVRRLRDDLDAIELEREQAVSYLEQEAEELEEWLETTKLEKSTGCGSALALIAGLLITFFAIGAKYFGVAFFALLATIIAPFALIIASRRRYSKQASGQAARKREFQAYANQVLDEIDERVLRIQQRIDKNLALLDDENA